MHRLLSAPREPVNALTHWGGVAGALLVLGPLLGWASARGVALWPFVVFGGSMALLYGASASYHSFRPGERGMLWLRKFDHASIFLLIAGTYTPMVYFGLSGGWRVGVLGLVWGVALAGIALKLLTMRLPRWVSTALYLALGWLSVALLPAFVRTLPAGAVIWLSVGGMLYTAGAVVYGTKRWNPKPGFFGFHEIWHLFVLGGTAAHVVMMFNLR